MIRWTREAADLQRLFACSVHLCRQAFKAHVLAVLCGCCMSHVDWAMETGHSIEWRCAQGRRAGVHCQVEAQLVSLKLELTCKQ